MMAAAAAFAVAATAATAINQLNQGQQAAGIGAYNASVNNDNARVAREGAAIDAGEIRRRGARAQSGVRATAGAAGLIDSGGSPYDVLLDNAAEIELEAQRRLFRGDTEAKGYESQGRLDSSKGQGALQSSYFEAGASVLGGASRAFGVLGGKGG